ncbi:hypothetical protein HU200_015062 [Digitaria exilis]|uniref:Uncharacterized protein n=1 Tax=Digitaria exilis TaxID=1010633 RepID=A0A835FAA1_9POAL|nr:hypothetical protein HU200_015062 [Digitaria exilis]
MLGYSLTMCIHNSTLSLGAASSVCGVVIGSMAVAQIFFSVYFSAWPNKSYFKPLIFSSIVLFFGNVYYVWYAMAYDMKSVSPYHRVSTLWIS